MKLYYRNVYWNVPGRRRGFGYGRISLLRHSLPHLRCRKWKHIGVETVAGEPGEDLVIVFFQAAKP